MNSSSFCWEDQVFHVLAARNLGQEQRLLSPYFSGGRSIQVKTLTRRYLPNKEKFIFKWCIQGANRKELNPRILKVDVQTHSIPRKCLLRWLFQLLQPSLRFGFSLETYLQLSHT